VSQYSLVLGLVLAGWTPVGHAAEPIDPLSVLETHCVRCHAGSELKGGLDLATHATLLRGGESGLAIDIAKPDDSFLLQTIRHQSEPHMPYKADRLSDSEIAVLTNWIKAGANYSRTLKLTQPARPTGSGFTLTEADRSHWSFQPVRSTIPPIVNGLADRAQNPIDQFIAQKLHAAGHTFSPVTSKEILIRRLTFDLTGLPPTLDEIDEFVSDTSPCSVERLIDRLLASPHYGERWARHWLDLARYAETDGYEHDAVRPHSWRYRDYVIRALNSDLPYDEFIREQLAGDELRPGEPDAMMATGFNLLGPDMVDSSDQVQRRHNTLNDMTDTTALVFLGLTLGCARCHDHKFEPLSQRDYYQLQAYFTSARFQREQPIPTPSVRAEYEVALQEYTQHPKRQELALIEAPVRQRLIDQKVAQLSPEAQTAHRTAPDQRNAEQANLVLETADKVKVSEKEIGAAFTTEERQQHIRLQDEVKKLRRPEPLPQAMVLVSGDSAKTYVLNRGEYSQPTDEVVAGIPTVLAASVSQSAEAASNDRPSTSRRHLANWISADQNPLTARVMVNRIWQHHFGRGLVSTPSDFGTHGQSPTHPELLDWLAHDFASHDWRMKYTHRQMLTSATYQQVSVWNNRSDKGSGSRDSTLWSNVIKADPTNRLYSRMNRLRLEGEAIRDSLLAISDRFNPAMEGPGVFPPIPKELFAGASGWSTSDHLADHARRSIYIFARRNLRFPFLEVFDAPDSNLSCPIREGSTTAPQSLTLLNADEVMLAATALSSRLKQSDQTIDGQIKQAYRLTLGRLPTTNESVLARTFLAKSPLEEFCRALFNVNEFVYVE